MNTQSNRRWVELPNGFVLAVDRDREWIRVVDQVPAMARRPDVVRYLDENTDSQSDTIANAEADGKTSCEWRDSEGNVYALTWTKLRTADLPDRTPEYLREGGDPE